MPGSTWGQPGINLHRPTMARTTWEHSACTPPCVRQLVVSVSTGAVRSCRWNAADTAANLKLVDPRVIVCAVLYRRK